MDTKLKKYRSYQKKWKIVGVALFFICAMANFFCGIITANISNHWNRDIIEAHSVYDTYEFKNSFAQALDEVILSEVYYRNESRISSGELIDREELLTDFKRYYGIKEGIITGNTSINETFDGLITHGSIPNSLKHNFDEYKELVESRLPLYRKMYIQNQLDDFKSSIRYLNGMTNFLYYVEDSSGNVVAGNTTRGEMSNIDRTIVLSSGFSSDKIGVMGYTSNNTIMETSDYKIYAGIREPFVYGDAFYTLGQEYVFAKAGLPILFGVFTASTIIIIFCLVYLIRVAGQSEKGGKVTYLAVDKIYNEVHFLLVIGLTAFAVFFGVAILSSILNETAIFWAYIFNTILGIIYICDIAAIISYIMSVSRQIKGKIFLRNTWVSVTIRRMSELFTGKTFRGWMIFVMLSYGLGNCVIMGFIIFAAQMGYYFICFLCVLGLFLFNAFCMYLFLRALRSLKRIMISARETSKGNLQYKLNLEEISPSFSNFAMDIANIQDGLKNSVEDAVKGERMKTELITNVSHDLKTPLTSIISYVDLLRSQKLENKAASEYVEILFEKSYRLKQLIEDLIEASKVSSGNITVSKMRLDYRQITLQAIGELEEKIEAAGLEVKVSCPEPLYISADGRHLWRILENLVSNAVKYSMPDSRVYIDIFQAEGRGILVMKNISATPIDFDETRLTDRFVRGDASRTTEGSGLGLSIAQSLAEAQGGTFGIKVDGDLFKAIVSMPLWEDGEQPFQEDEVEMQ
ncbi:sensor histidine kinase [Anaerotignum propionicum]|uniref:sensor histidine kinase n=1 Tax=Anaerotignum propionicum TaxID=28446 RepID=UPI00210C0D83|nr:HAMP domain-containing sensor histidine kinase [Anaerotignum propionicum]MCQ4935918.1 HAMP domain-containing histidine kinase [Anaerotignum propionicum]